MIASGIIIVLSVLLAIVSGVLLALTKELSECQKKIKQREMTEKIAMLLLSKN